MHPVRFSGVTLHPLDRVDRREQRQQRVRSAQQFCKEGASNGTGRQVFLAWLAMYTLQIALHTNHTRSHLAETCRRRAAGTPEAHGAAGGDEPSGKMWESYVVVSHEFRQKTELGCPAHLTQIDSANHRREHPSSISSSVCAATMPSASATQPIQCEGQHRLLALIFQSRVGIRRRILASITAEYGFRSAGAPVEARHLCQYRINRRPLAQLPGVLLTLLPAN